MFGLTSKNTELENPHIEIEQDPEGASWVQKPVHVLPFLFVEKGFCLLALPWVPKNRPKQLLIREVKECRNKGKSAKQEK